MVWTFNLNENSIPPSITVSYDSTVKVSVGIYSALVPNKPTVWYIMHLSTVDFMLFFATKASSFSF